MKTRAAIALIAFAAAAAAPAAVPAPRISVPSVAALPQPLPLPYDEAAPGLPAVQKARALAAKQGKKLLIDPGGNWCGDCRVLAGILQLPEMKAWVARHFVVVAVDVGRFNKNGDVAAHYGITRRLDGVPAILVVDPRRDTLVNKGNLFALTDARHMAPQALADWLARWA